MGAGTSAVIQDKLRVSAVSERAIKVTHLAIIIIGAIAYSAVANYDALWFDEAYSVGIAQHAFSEIADIGSYDVHPVLYYFALHAIYLVAGPNVVAFRLFSVAGSIALAILGFTHCRRDFGSRCGLLFSVFALFLPWSIRVAFQIRMYSWLAAVVMLAAIYGWRIVKMSVSEALGPDGMATAIPLKWWLVLTLASIAAAYLHYYGAMAAFYVQLVVLVSVLRSPAGRKRNVIAWMICALIAVLAYIPWLSVVASQAKTVAGGFWINLGYPGSFPELVSFPFNSPEALRFLEELNEGVDSSGFVLALMMVVLLVEGGFVYGFGKAIGESCGTTEAGRLESLSALYFFSVFVAVAFIAGVASMLINQPVLYYRYVAVALGPLALAMAYVITCVKSRVLRSLACALVIAWGVFGFAGLVSAAYDPGNEEAISAYIDVCNQAAEQNEGQRPLVLSSDEGLASILAESNSGDRIVYVSGAQKYRAFEPRFILVSSCEEALRNYSGIIVYVGSFDEAKSLAQSCGGVVIDTKSRIHPYSAREITYTMINAQANR